MDTCHQSYSKTNTTILNNNTNQTTDYNSNGKYFYI